ncbi:hypothetical protein CHS0354_040411 [Potamilus streckersoni]|uniref:Uncharacterized protein n=1 Tax=Potamilus streckersoni TaxID=2493646 RepID=A0AAE0W3Z7_9BIVA|nr:hypothetical protein CHS0354_040411 [Potamilus streckersoni]
MGYQRQKNRLLMHLVIGMGVLLLTGFSVCILQNERSNQVPDIIPHHESVEGITLQTNPSGGYWTIVYNEEGDLRTALESDIDDIYEPSSIANIIVVDVDTRKASPTLQRTDVGMEFDGYIHAIHAGPVNSGVMLASDVTEA